MPCTRYIDSPTKNQIIEAMKSGRKQVSVATEYQVGKDTVRRLWERYQNEGTVKRRAKSGRPTKTTARQDRNMVNYVRQDPNRTATDATAYVNQVLEVPISTKTASRRLRKAGLFARRPARRPMLTKKHMKARLEFARDHEHWTVQDWGRVLWSDEVKINLINPDGGPWVRRPLRMRCKLKYVRPTVKFGGGSIMVWGKSSLILA